MSLLQGDVMPRSLAKHVLRQRIYSCCLDFFCADKIYPCKSGQALKEDVQVSRLKSVFSTLIGRELQSVTCASQKSYAIEKQLVASKA